MFADKQMLVGAETKLQQAQFELASNEGAISMEGILIYDSFTIERILISYSRIFIL